MYLLDTHTLIWLLFTKGILPDAVYQAVATSEYVYASIVSLWEIAIKQSIGKLEIKNSIAEIADICEESGYELLPIKPIHLDCVKTLPIFHRDPFDRLLIAQATTEGLTIITKDAIIPRYPVKTMWNDMERENPTS